jgi:lysophospholipase
MSTHDVKEIDDAKDAAIRGLWEIGKQDTFESQHPSSGAAMKIHYRTFEQADQNAAVVISSGRTECMFKYDETIYDLYQEGYSVYIHDHRGQGFSGSTTGKEKDSECGHGPGHVENFDFYVDDLHHFVTHVVQPSQRELTGSDQDLLLLAHSMGGGIASLYIEKHKRVFKAAALCSPMHEPDLGLLPGVAVESIAALKRLKGNAKDYAGKGGPYDKGPFDEMTAKDVALTHSRQRYERVRKMFEEHKEARVGGASYRWVDLAIDAAEDARDNASNIGIDVLLLQATEDIAVTPDGQNKFCDILNAKHPGCCTLVPIEGGYHELLIESDDFRNKAMDEVLAFLAAHA